MMKANVKRAISFGVFGLGILASLWGCLAYVGAMFVVGGNDSPQEVRAITFALATPLPACFLALWKRIVGGAWLIFAGFYYIYGTLVQRAYMIDVRHFNNQLTVSKTVMGSLFIAVPLIALGTFSVITGLKWPSLWEEPSEPGSAAQPS